MYRFLGCRISEKPWELNLTFKGLSRLMRHKPLQALPITPKVLLEFFTFLDMSNPFDSTIWTLFLIAFYCMLRKSNLIPNSSRTFDHTKQLCRSDLMLISNMLVVNIKWSKTIQSSERVMEIPLPSVDSPLCPVAAFKNVFLGACTRECPSLLLPF